jgi:cyclopropane fatty-acyl-phospholipid synthase-like methyltransferase
MKKHSCFLCKSNNIEPLIFGKIHVTKCNNCEFQLINDSKNILGDSWFSNYYADDRSDDTAKNILREKQYLIDAKFLSQYIKRNMSILDVGCSHGGFLSVINQLKKDTNLCGIDIDPSAIKEAKLCFSEIAEFEEKNLLDIDSDKKYDVIIFRGTLQYLSDKLHESMEHIHTITHEDSKVIILSLPSTDAFMFYLLRDKWPLFHPEMALMFNENSIHQLAKMHKFKIERLEYPYINEVYSNRVEDYKKIKEMIIKQNFNNSVPFLGSIMTTVFSKS